LEQFAREKIRGYLQDLLEQEVSEWLGREKSERKVNADEQPGYRNGYGRPRRLAMSLGTIEIQRPRVRDLSERFKSKVLPMFKRQSQEVRELIPELYLHGLASGDFELALRHLLGNGAPLSASSLQRLKEKWQDEYTQWTKVPIEQARWAYLWADGIYVKAGLGKEKAALLVVIGVKSDGSKCFLALEAGQPREQRVVGQCLTSASGARVKGASAIGGRRQFGVMGGGERGLSSGSTTVVLES
jgi:transposase-like protein